MAVARSRATVDDAVRVRRLVAAARDGDADGWRELHDRYDGLVLAVARRHGLGGPEREDVSQTTWLRLVEHIGSLREDVALPGWLATTARREALRVLRHRGREVPTEACVLADRCTGRYTGAGPDDPDELDDAIDVRRVVDRVGRAVAGLPERERRLMQALLDPRPLSYRQLGARLGMPVGAIGPVRQRAIRRLRGRLAGTPCDDVG